MMLNSLRQTVATPRKKPGLDPPSIASCNPLTSTNVPRCALTSVVIPPGYNASTGGRNNAETVLVAPSLFVPLGSDESDGVIEWEMSERRERSDWSVRG